jgi:hypothetical protein
MEFNPSKMPSIERWSLQAAALFRRPVSPTRLRQVLTALDVRPRDGRKLNHAVFKPLVASMVWRGWLKESGTGLLCRPEWAEAMVSDAAALGRLPTLAQALGRWPARRRPYCRAAG